jgi:hypothetical protein
MQWISAWKPGELPKSAESAIGARDLVDDATRWRRPLAMRPLAP